MVTKKEAPSVLVPRSINAATARLTTLDGIATAAGWERAAIVYAFTQDGRGATPGSPALSFAEFAELGVAGLSNKDTVARYHRAWAEAVEVRKAKKIKPGDSVKLPTIEFPQDKPRLTHISVPAVVRHIEREPEFIESVIRQSPVAQRAARREVLSGSSFIQSTRAEPTAEDHLIDSVGNTLDQRYAVSRALAGVIDAIDVATARLRELDPEERTEFQSSVENAIGRMHMMAALVEGVPDDVSALETER